MSFLSAVPNNALALLLTSLLVQQPTWERAAELIQQPNLKGELFFLASDDLKGRNAGSSEGLIAADYIASEFMRLGLKPGGDNNTYFQNVELVTGDVDREHLALTAKIKGVDRSFKVNQDFRWVRQSLHPATSCGSLIFAGYGIDAPEYGYSDFSNVNIKGKVVLAFNREPQADDPQSKFMGTLDTYHAFNAHKIEEIRKRGAAGLLLIQDRNRRAIKQTPASSPRPLGGTDFALAGEMWDLPVFTVQREAADQLLAPTGQTANELQTLIDRTLQPQSLAVPESSACMVKAVNNIEKHNGRNVVGLLEGFDPALSAETIIVAAHHDHMGVANGHIYNGADDNASGVAGLVEIARALVAGNVRPRRSVLFISYEGEERIFLGSYYYLTHPLRPLEKTVAELNMDMIGRNENDANWPVPPDGNENMVNVLGTRYNPGLRRVIDQQNRQVGLKLDYKMDFVDPDSLWSRSDHFWFAARHIPQVEFQTGLHPDYHTDRDTWDRINYAKLTKIIRLVFLSVADLASTGARISFNAAGSE